MPLFIDATALRRFAALDELALLRSFDLEIVIGPEVLVELGRVRSPIEAAANQGWIRVDRPSRNEVGALLSTNADLNQGEAEVLVLAGHYWDADSILAIDEGEAYRYARRISKFRERLRCVARLLQELQDMGTINSALELFQQLLADGPHKYNWAPVVWCDYARWCETNGKPPLPHPNPPECK